MCRACNRSAASGSSSSIRIVACAVAVGVCKPCSGCTYVGVVGRTVVGIQHTVAVSVVVTRVGDAVTVQVDIVVAVGTDIVTIVDSVTVGICSTWIDTKRCRHDRGV